MPDVPEEAPASEFFPKDIWKQAGSQLAALSEEEKQSKREEIQQQFKAIFEGLRDADANTLRQEGFLGSFSPFDLLFFGLAIASAWGIASRDEAA